jgi:hypothetical protein
MFERMSLVVQNDVEQRFVNSDAPVVFNETERAKTIHEEADTLQCELPLLAISCFGLATLLHLNPGQTSAQTSSGV